MQIDSTKDFKRPRVKVLEKFRAPDRFEAVMSSMNITTTRLHGTDAPTWDCSIHWNNAPRAFRATLAESVSDETFTLTVTSALADGVVTMDFYDLPDGGCRVISKAEVKAKQMMVKLALQSLRLVRGKAEERLTRLVTAFGRP